MKASPAPGQVSFDCQQVIFGAFDAATGMLILVVEADSDVQALERVNSVAPLLGVRCDSELLVAQLDQMLPGVPTFLRSFFEAGMIGFNRGNVAPGSPMLQ